MNGNIILSYYIIQVNNKDTLFDNITLLHNQKMIICGLIIFLAVTYIYIYYYDGEFILFNYI